MYGVQVGMRARGARGRFGLFFVAIAVLGLFGGAASWANERGGVSPEDIDRYIGIVQERVESRQTGAEWLRRRTGEVHRSRLPVSIRSNGQP